MPDAIKVRQPDLFCVITVILGLVELKIPPPTLRVLLMHGNKICLQDIVGHIPHSWPLRENSLVYEKNIWYLLCLQKDSVGKKKYYWAAQLVSPQTKQEFT